MRDGVLRIILPQCNIFGFFFFYFVLVLILLCDIFVFPCCLENQHTPQCFTCINVCVKGFFFASFCYAQRIKTKRFSSMASAAGTTQKNTEWKKKPKKISIKYLYIEHSMTRNHKSFPINKQSNVNEDTE